jgi:hypothetical protein
MTVNLSLVRPDFESIRTQLEATLGNYEAWRDLLPTGTGRALTDWISAIGANDQYAIEHAFRESFRTARLDSSILAQAILLGVRLSRKRPCNVEVTLSKASNTVVTLPAYTMFSSNNAALFCRDAITLNGTTPVTVTLYEGTVKTVETTGDGSAYQLFVTSDDKFTVSDIDVEVELNDVVLTRTTRGLWRLEDTAGVMDTTTQDGQCLLTFGGGGYGTTPQASDRVKVTYAITRGALGQNANIQGENITCNDAREITGVAVSGLSGGGDEKPVEFYRKVGPQLFASREGATTEDEYAALAARFSGVLDARVLGQRNVAPADVRWMNMVQVSLLTATPWSGLQWDAFDKWFRERSIYPVRLYRADPQPVVVNVSAKAFCQGRADLPMVKATIEEQIRKLFAPRPGLIDSNIYLSDLHAAIKGSDSAVEYAEVVNPLEDVLVRVDSPRTLNLTTVGGTLPPGQYSYAVTAVTSSGETLATNFTSRVLTAAGGIQISWDPVFMASQYRIYGRTPLNLGLLGTATGTTFTDASLTAPVTGLPLVNSAGHFYPKLGTLNIVCEYTNRAFYNLGNLR